jgi:adenosylmethionine-8-amino-7-oxononanoate aminotransferase
VAAFFAEPIVGTTASGLTPHPGYYKRVREICDAYDVLFVADEVLCGYGRAGAPFAITAWSVEPDIVTLGKAIGSGYAPLAAMVVSGKVRSAFAEGTGKFVHGLTYSGSPSSCFVGLKINEIMHREGLFTRPADIGAFILARLRELEQRHEIIGEVRGRGLLIGVEFVADRRTRKPFPREARITERVVAHMRSNGVLVAAGMPLANFGKDGDHIQISPPFTITEAEALVIVAALDEALTAVAHDAVPTPA